MRYKPNYAPGPTEVRENVRLARAKRTNNSDFDKTFVRYYREVSQKIPTFTVAKPKNPHKSRYICVYGDFFIFWYVDMHACVCLFSRRGEYLLTQAHPECR